MILKLKINGRTNFTQDQAIKYDGACERLMNVLNSVQFRNHVLTAKFDLRTTLGLSNDEIYLKIMGGAETLTPEQDHEIDITVEMYRKQNKVVGYTYDSTEKMWVNENFFEKYDFAQVAGNIFHEWLHKIGFNHQSSIDYDSVVYLLGYLVRDMIIQVEAGLLVLTSIEDVYTPELPEPKPIVVENRKYICKRSWLPWWKKVCWYE